MFNNLIAGLKDRHVSRFDDAMNWKKIKKSGFVYPLLALEYLAALSWCSLVKRRQNDLVSVQNKREELAKVV